MTQSIGCFIFVGGRSNQLKARSGHWCIDDEPLAQPLAGRLPLFRPLKAKGASVPELLIAC